MQMIEPILTVDVLRMAVLGGDPAIQALPDLGDGQRPSGDAGDQRPIHTAGERIRKLRRHSVVATGKFRERLARTRATNQPRLSGQVEELPPFVVRQSAHAGFVLLPGPGYRAVM